MQFGLKKGPKLWTRKLRQNREHSLSISYLCALCDYYTIILFFQVLGSAIQYLNLYISSNQEKNPDQDLNLLSGYCGKLQGAS